MNPVNVILTFAIFLISILSTAQTQQPTPDYGPIVDANTRFALKIVRTRAKQLKENEVVSPIALSAGFALLRNGANPQCSGEIGSAFEFGKIPEDNTNREYAALMHELLNREPEFATLSSGANQKSRQSRKGLNSELTPPNGLYLANSFWNLWANFSEPFREVNDSFYHAEVANIRRPEDAVAKINEWARRKSYGRVTRVVSTIPGDAFMFTSLFYFREHWHEPFLASNTHPANFTLLPGTTKTVQMMKQSGHFSYAQTSEMEALVLPYSEGRALYIFLPDKTSSLPQFEATLTDENWKKWTGLMSRREGTVELPKFRIGGKVDVQKLVADVGSDCAFASFAAFSKAFPLEGAKLTHAEELLSFAADERGSEAVVYTGVGGVPGGVAGGMLSMQAPPPFHMVVDRPFFAAVVDEHTRTMVLVSSVVEP